jgi:hypothetical protein
MTFPKKLQKFVKPLDLHVKFPISTYCTVKKIYCLKQ